MNRRTFLKIVGGIGFVACMGGRVIDILNTPPQPKTHSSSSYFVDEIYGNDKNSGKSPTQAFKTIQRAVAESTNGHTIWVLPEIINYDWSY